MTVPIDSTAATAAPSAPAVAIRVDGSGHCDPAPVLVQLSSGRPARRPEPPESFTIDCADCRHQGSAVCDECVVSFIVGREPEDAVVIDAGEARAVRLLEQAGLVPGVRHSRQASGL
jgi:hypothetical protein